MVEVTFRVRAVTDPGQIVCVVGNNKTLGQWNPRCAVSLSQEANDLWSCCITLDLKEDILYRYMVCHGRESHQNSHTMQVIRWEANIKPRILSSKDYAEETRKFASGTAVFGEYEKTDNIVNNGWLMNHTEIHLELRDNPIQMLSSRHQQQTYRVKCTPLDYTHSNDIKNGHDADDEEPVHATSSQSVISVASLKDGQCRPYAQPECGEMFLKDDFLIFTTQTTDPENLGFQLDFYVHYEDKPAKHMGYSYILPVDTSTTKSSKVIPISSLSHKPIGKIKVSYFVAKPVPDLTMLMDVSYQSYWGKDAKSVDVGHRGLGSSYKHKKLAAVRENTIASLQSAGSHGADYVEFDVMLSKDMVPVIFHDFHVCITYRKKKKEHQLLKLGVKDLSVSELQSMKLADKTAIGDEEHDIDGEDLDHIHHQPFPTLQECYQLVDEKIGFNVEVKFPQQKMDGELEDEHFWDRNEYVDIVLRNTFECARGRKIIFSSFDPETCLLLRLKQNRYPVLFLTNGGAKCYLPYSDVREQSMPMAIHFAQFADILGIDVCTEVLCTRPENIQETKAAGLVLFCWGEDSNNSDTIRRLRDQGVDGIIYDRLDLHRPVSYILQGK
ncbi:glycerophosphocholine phosphodiesterase GPCPD1-like isoform X2 [Mizuhopecten yessoensis]|uniref:glycerophosphocholine phosphodiesterase GPCPD1-like isoform X2 n=1 Tax=Mizuhopecten yessoensis TaxID=6573 RepID=UPI000B45A6AC|nr:glycerophosphocholine phosphodiesterase GPCPD1-like isoform X2 [Mizuhopecten yessoensis]